MTLWVYTDGTKYSLPLAVADSAVEMAKITGYCPQSISKAWWNYKHGVAKKTRFEKVKVEYEDKFDG